MADYRIFFLGLDERITDVAVVSCENDVAALAAAGVVRQHDGGIEVWQAARMVGRVDRSVSRSSVSQ